VPVDLLPVTFGRRRRTLETLGGGALEPVLQVFAARLCAS